MIAATELLKNGSPPMRADAVPLSVLTHRSFAHPATKKDRGTGSWEPVPQ
jgi:hypothetical protein